MAVVDMAQCRGEELGTIEKNLLGTTHAESGAKFLARWGISAEILTIVSFHDQPFQVPHSDFCPLRLSILPMCWKVEESHKMVMGSSGGRERPI